MNPETPDFKRLFMAVFLMTALLMGYNALFGPKQKAVPAKPVSTQQAPTPTPIATTAPKVEVHTAPIITREVVQNGYKAVLSSEGAHLQNFELTGYQTSVVFAPGFTLVSRDGNLTLSAQTRYELVNQEANSISFQKLTPENIRVTRKYQFGSKPFVVQHEVELRNQSNTPKAISLDMLMQTKEGLKHDEEHLKVAFHLGDEHKQVPWKDLEEHPENILGSPEYVGFDRRYFLISLAPEAHSTESTKVQGLKINLRQKTFILAPGTSQVLAFSSYLGPKETHLLQEAGHHLVENIDYGWFGVLSKPLLWLLTWINSWAYNFGLAIILLTILIKILTFPLTQKSFSAQQQMKKIAPKLKELQKKYSHDKAMLGQQQMAFYKEEGINPMAGCLPILIQMPVWFALYQMLGNSVELYEQPFYSWITDLTKPDPYYVLPLAMGISMLISQWIMPPALDDSQPQMKYVLWFMPVFLTFIMLNLPAGLSIYMLVNNLLTIAQQVYVKQRYEVPQA